MFETIIIEFAKIDWELVIIATSALSVVTIGPIFAISKLIQIGLRQRREP